MQTADIRLMINHANYEFSELGDKSAALMSLKTGKVISLNEIATIVVRDVLSESYPPTELSEYATKKSFEISKQYPSRAENIKQDIDVFLETLVDAIEQG